MTFWQLDSIKAVTAGRWLARGPQTKDAPPVAGLSTDSRGVQSGQAFLALRGERFDGHAFLAQASTAGAALLIIDREEAFRAAAPGIRSGTSVLLVEDTGRALLRLANAYRRTLTTTKVIAVGGSNGKTTTVRMIDAVLSTRLKGRASQKSFNNAVGVPLTILSAQPGDQYLICEVGTNAPGEIAPLAAVIEPDICVITSLGREHLEGLGSLEGVAREEAMLVSALREGGCAVVAQDDVLVAAVKSQLRSLAGPPRVLLTFGTGETAEVRVAEASQSFEGVRFTLNDRTGYALPLLGRHNALNAAAAIAVGRRLGLAAEDARTGLASVKGPPMRLEQSTVAGVRVVNDAYNANPESMVAAIDTFKEVTAADPAVAASRRVLVLGDMLELGEQSAALHREVLTHALHARCADVLVLIGSAMARAATDLKVQHEVGVHSLPDLSPPRDAHAAALLQPGDVVLLKASRGTAVERVVAALGGPAPLAEAKPSPTSPAATTSAGIAPHVSMHGT
ncbi:MAG TPA: UDP-N-acetylmuramoyl-tripeptide--D-alanyl-D-alanine ligase [Phycisphaerales bacterium]|nr:UDP-N-acetylmuramoyl-tripeptide--D-alanyl-D-alanine ligase [Phycisphaerales bacterium]